MLPPPIFQAEHFASVTSASRFLCWSIETFFSSGTSLTRPRSSPRSLTIIVTSATWGDVTKTGTERGDVSGPQQMEPKS